MNKKQILVIALVLVIITAGVLQYTYGRTGFSAQKDQEDRLGEAVYVNNPDGELVDLSAESTDDADDTDEEDAVTTSNDYFVQARLDRESTRSRLKEELNELTSGDNASGQISEQAQEEYLDIIKRTDIEATIESLIKQRGIEDVVVILGSTGRVDLVVKADSLSQDETAQISDIVMGHADVEYEDIHIKNQN